MNSATDPVDEEVCRPINESNQSTGGCYCTDGSSASKVSARSLTSRPPMRSMDNGVPNRSTCIVEATTQRQDSPHHRDHELCGVGRLTETNVVHHVMQHGPSSRIRHRDIEVPVNNGDAGADNGYPHRRLECPRSTPRGPPWGASIVRTTSRRFAHSC